MQLCFWNSQPSDIMIRMAPLTTYQHHHTFSCCRNGPHMLCHVISPSMYSSHCQMEKWHVPKKFMIQSYCHGGFICHGYICILLYLQLISCTGVGEIYGHVDGGVHLPLVYLHSCISATYFMYWCSRDGWSFGRGVHLTGICAFCIYTTSFPYKCHCYCVILFFIPHCLFTIRY